MNLWKPKTLIQSSKMATWRLGKSWSSHRCRRRGGVHPSSWRRKVPSVATCTGQHQKTSGFIGISTNGWRWPRGKARSLNNSRCLTCWCLWFPSQNMTPSALSASTKQSSRFKSLTTRHGNIKGRIQSTERAWTSVNLATCRAQRCPWFQHLLSCCNSRPRDVPVSVGRWSIPRGTKGADDKT